MNSSSVQKECVTSEHRVSSVKSEEKGAAKPTDCHIEPKRKTRATTPVRSNRDRDAMIALSSVRKILAHSRSMLEGLELAEGVLAAQRPEIIDLCSSPQDRASVIKLEEKLSDSEKVVTDPDQAAATTLKRESVSPLAEITTPDEKAKLPSLFDASPIHGTRLMFESATAEENVSRTFNGLKEQLENNLEIIRKAAKEREMLMVLLQDKTNENAMLSSLMIELSDKQALMSEQLEREYELMNKELENTRNLKREMLNMYARLMDKERRITACKAKFQGIVSEEDGIHCAIK
jgi:hypothetical protein